MNNEDNLQELKVKLWAITGIQMTMDTAGIETGLEEKETMEMLKISLDIYKDTDMMEQIIEAQKILYSLIEDIRNQYDSKGEQL